jgi:hypothetical protein
MVAVMTAVLMFLGIGVMAGVGICVMAIETARKKAPIIYFSISDRQNGSACEILKVRKTTYKDGTKGFESKPTVMGSGIGAMFAKWTPVNPIERQYTLTKKGGGVGVITFSPCENVELPVELKKDEERLKLIVQTIDVGNWYRGALKSTVLSKLLNPKEGFWAKHPGAVIIMSGIIVLMLLVVGLVFIPQIATSHNAQLTSMISSLSDSFTNLGVNIGASTGGATVIR